MKNSLLISLLAILASSPKGYAQLRHWITLDLQDFYRYDHTFKTNDTFDVTENKGIIFRTSVGYYTLVGKTSGVGIDIGYGSSSTPLKSTVMFDGYTNKLQQENKARLFFFQPRFFDLFEHRNFQIILSATLPITYVTPSTRSLLLEDRRPDPSLPLLQAFHTYNSPAELEIGVCGDVRVQRRIFKRIYAGASVAVGVFIRKGLGQMTYNAKFVAGSDVEERNYVTDYSQDISTRLDMRPSIGLSYNF